MLFIFQLFTLIRVAIKNDTIQSKKQILMINKISPILIIVLCVVTYSANAKSKDQSLNTFDILFGGAWSFDGKWPNGTEFKQEYKFEWSLNKKIVNVTTFGTINMETNEHGLRNKGIRAWDNQTQEANFWEFDIFGGITEGKCIIDGKDIIYEYEYNMEGKSELFNDVWRFIDDNTYNTYQYTVRMKNTEGWKVFTTNELKRKN